MNSLHKTKHLLGLLFLYGISLLPLRAEIDDPLRNRINLALRQVAHHALLAQGDSTTHIAPVQYDGQQGFLLPLRRAIAYDSLPSLLEQAFLDYHITHSYEIMVISCGEGIPLLGFNKAALHRGSVPCLGREHVMHCANLFVQFEAEEPYFRIQKSLMAWLLLPILLGLGLIAYKKLGIKTGSEQTENTYPLGQFRYDPQKQLLLKGDKQVELTFRENKLLHLFVCQPNTVLERAEILSAVWEEEGVIVGRSLDVFISRLRKLLKPDPSVQIKTIHGVGYRLELPL